MINNCVRPRLLSVWAHLLLSSRLAPNIWVPLMLNSSLNHSTQKINQTNGTESNSPQMPTANIYTKVLMTLLLVNITKWRLKTIQEEESSCSEIVKPFATHPSSFQEPHFSQLVFLLLPTSWPWYIFS